MLKTRDKHRYWKKLGCENTDNQSNKEAIVCKIKCERIVINNKLRVLQDRIYINHVLKWKTKIYVSMSKKGKQKQLKKEKYKSEKKSENETQWRIEKNLSKEKRH